MQKIFSVKMSPTLYKCTFRVLFFLFSWLYLWLVYGDVLYQLQEQSLWFFAPFSDYETLRIELDPFTYVTRFCITIFAIPVLGAFVLSLFLSAIEWFTEKIFAIGTKLFLLAFIPSIGLLFYIGSHDMTIFYGHENSMIFKVILIAFLVFLLALPVSSFFRHKSENSVVSTGYAFFNLIILALAFFFVNLYGSRDKEFRTITKLKYNMDCQKWSKVANIAESSGVDNRVVAGYHAAALAQMGQIGERLFKVGYDFPELKSTGKIDDIMKGDVLCTPQMLLYGGLLQPAYHYAFEYYIIYGNHKEYLRIMVKSRVLCGDTRVADKLLNIMERMPFEGSFVKKYRSYNHNPEEMSKDYELAPILDLKSTNDMFEQGLGMPLAPNFYTSVNGRKCSQRFQDLSLAGPLYNKNPEIFAKKCSVLIKRSYKPQYFQEALAALAAQYNKPEILTVYKISPEINARVNNFLSDASVHRGEPDRGKASMAKKYKGTFMFYLYYQNEFLPQIFK